MANENQIVPRQDPVVGVLEGIIDAMATGSTLQGDSPPRLSPAADRAAAGRPTASSFASASQPAQPAIQIQEMEPIPEASASDEPLGPRIRHAGGDPRDSPATDWRAEAAGRPTASGAEAARPPKAASKAASIN